MVCASTSHVPVFERGLFFPRVNIHYFLFTEMRFSCRSSSYLQNLCLSFVQTPYASSQRRYGNISLKEEAFFLLHYNGFRSSAHSFSPLIFASLWMSLFLSIFMSSVRPERDIGQVYLSKWFSDKNL